ncbi:50S ribosomal protein L32e [Candidatus Woesearchaeota archaeon]|nr:50S ribosomal protein L32e [Candidatus Woesearchaeota archaeon]
MNKIELRKAIKAKKPVFVSQDSHKRKRLSKKWQKPKGWQSKIRLNKRGYRKTVRPGYGSPKAAYSLDPSGLEAVRIHSISELSKINKETQGIIIASVVGTKNKISIINKAKEAGIKILNIKDPDAYLKKVEESIKKKKEEKAKRTEKKQAEKKKAKKKEEKDKLQEKLSEDEKKDEEKKEKEKVLTKKEA